MAYNETTADIIAEMHGEAARADMEQGYSLDDAAEMMREFASRFEAAWKRERGDAAKLREVCEKMLDLLTAEGFEDGGMSIELDEKQVIMWRNRFRAALSAPPRNCDVIGNTGRALVVHGFPTKSNQWGEGEWLEFIDWLFATATEKEGGEK